MTPRAGAGCAPRVRRRVRGRVAAGALFVPIARRADAARPSGGERAPGDVAATHARSNPLGRPVAVRAAAHDHRHRALGRRALPDRGRRSDAARAASRPAGHAGRGLTVNIAIVGVNQITDVEIDRINKPWLPIAAGELSLGAARVIVASCTALRSAMAVTQGAVVTVAVAAALAVGALYSLPPSGSSASRSPRRCASPACAASSSTSASTGTSPGTTHRPPVWALCLFVLPF